MQTTVTGPKGRNPATRDVRRGFCVAEPVASSPPPVTIADGLSSFDVVRQLGRALERREESIAWLLAMLERDDLPPAARPNATRALVLAVATFGAGRVDVLADAVLERHRAGDAILEGLAALGAAGLRGLERILDVADELLAERAIAAVQSAGETELARYLLSRSPAENTGFWVRRGFLTLLLLRGSTAMSRSVEPSFGADDATPKRAHVPRLAEAAAPAKRRVRR